MKPYRNRTVPYKLLSLLLYGEKPFLKRLELGRIQIKTGDTARALTVSNNRLIESLEWLKSISVITKIDYPLRGTAIVEVRLPDLFSPKETPLE